MADQTTLDGETKVQHTEEQATATDPSVSVFVDHVMREFAGRAVLCAGDVLPVPLAERTDDCLRGWVIRNITDKLHLPRGTPCAVMASGDVDTSSVRVDTHIGLGSDAENPHGHAGLDAMIQRIKAWHASGSVDPFVEDVDLARDRGPEHSDQCLVCVSTCREVAQILRYVLPCVLGDTAIVFSVKERPGRPVNVTIAIPSKRRRVAEVNETGKTACPPDE